MIAYLKGQVLQMDEETMIVETQGVGYEVACSQQCLSALTGQSTVELQIYTHVREDQICLFGFISLAEKKLFLSLLKVNGIGPKVAMKILGAAPLAEIIRRIDEGDVRALSQLPKVGKKTAETIVLELKGKLVLLDDQIRTQGFAARNDIVSALVNLGFRIGDVEKVVMNMDSATDAQEGVRQGLKLLTSP